MHTNYVHCARHCDTKKCLVGQGLLGKLLKVNGYSKADGKEEDLAAV